MRAHPPLTVPPDLPFAGRRPDYCACGAITTPIAVDEGTGRLIRACVACGQEWQPPRLPACPRCYAPTYSNHAGDLLCLAGCKPVRIPVNDPRAAWETCHDLEDTAELPEEWGYAGVAGWCSIEPTGGLARLVGCEDDRGDWAPGDLDAEWEARVAANDARVEEIVEAIFAFGRACQNDPSVRRCSSFAQYIGETVCRVLINCIIARGGSISGYAERVALGRLRVTPYANYRHAMAFAHGERGASGIGVATSTLANIGVEYTHALRGGVVLAQRVTVSPSHSGSSAARGEALWADVEDVCDALSAARVGGVWEEPGPEQREANPFTPWTCAGGRPLTKTEWALLRLCDVGAEDPTVPRDEREWKTWGEADALRIVKATADRSGELWAEVRHMTPKDAAEAVQRARRAIREALVAYGQIPADEVRRKTRKRTDADGVVAVDPMGAL